MEWNEEAVARLRELWSKGLSTAEIGRQLNVTKNAVVGKAHRLGLEGRPSPIRRASVKKEKPADTTKVTEEVKAVKDSAKEAVKEKVVKEKVEKAPKVASATKVEKAPELNLEVEPPKAEVKTFKKVKLDFISPAELPKRRSNSDCCWPIGDPGTKGFHFCGAKAIPGKPYCLEHVQIAYVKLKDKRGNVA